MFRQKNVILKPKSKQKVLDEKLQFRLLEELKQIQSGKETDERLVGWLEGYFQMGKKEEQHIIDVKERFYQYSILELYRQLIERDEDGYYAIKDVMSEMFNAKQNTHYTAFISYLDESINMKSYEGLQLLTILLLSLQKIHDNQKRREDELVELLGKNKNSMNATEDYDAQFKKSYYLVNITRKILDHFRFPKQFYRLKMVIGLQECKLEFTREHIEPILTSIQNGSNFAIEKQQHVLECLQMWLDRCDMNDPSQKMILREVFEKIEMLIEKIDQNNPYRNLLFGLVSDKKNEAFPIRRSRPAIYAQGAGSRRK